MLRSVGSCIIDIQWLGDILERDHHTVWRPFLISAACIRRPWHPSRPFLTAHRLFWHRYVVFTIFFMNLFSRYISLFCRVTSNLCNIQMPLHKPFINTIFVIAGMFWQLANVTKCVMELLVVTILFINLFSRYMKSFSYAHSI